VVTKPTAAGLIAAGLLSVVVFPAASLALLRGGRHGPTDLERVAGPGAGELARSGGKLPAQRWPMDAGDRQRFRPPPAG
jgi:hypothetical protein